MSTVLAEKPQQQTAAELVVRTRGIFQLRREADTWVCSAILYGSSITLQPVTMTEARVHELFKLAHIEQAELNETNIIVEFKDSEITAEALKQFGF
jgi:hypothetical protein